MSDDGSSHRAAGDSNVAIGPRSRRWVLGALAATASSVSGAKAQDSGWFGLGPLFGSQPAVAAKPRPAPRRPIPVRKITPPDFALIDPEKSYRAGIRPWRAGGMRIKREHPVEIAGRTRHLIHNYGHGGAGISLAFGAAETTRGHIAGARENGAPGDDRASVAVIGAGVIGLTTAYAIVERHPDIPVTIYARDIAPERTTSWLAGGQFAHASTLGEYHTSTQRALLDRHLDLAEQRLSDLQRSGRAARFGIVRRTAYSLNPGNGHGLRLAMGKATRSASSYETWLIDPHRLLPALQSELRERGVRFVQRELATERDIFDLPDSIIVNCTGFGSRDLVNDSAVEGRRGHIVVFDNPGKLDYFLNSWCGDAAPRYLFARHDDIVIGGTTWNDCSHDGYEPSYPADVRAIERIIASARGLFETAQTCT